MGLENNTIVSKLFFKSLPDSCEEDGIRDTENVGKILRQESVAKIQEMLMDGNPNQSSRVMFAKFWLISGRSHEHTHCFWRATDSAVIRGLKNPSNKEDNKVTL